MKKRAITAVISFAMLGYALGATADDRLVRFEGGIGVIPARAGGLANTVRGVQPGGQVWVISRLSVDVRTDGRISVDGRGLLLGGGENIGLNGGQSVRVRLFCGAALAEVAHDSALVPLEANGDFRIEGTLTPVPPAPCVRPVALIVSGGGSWFAAGIPKQ